MGKRQFRRSISVAARTYMRIETAIANGRVTGSVSGYIERLIAADLDAKDVPAIDAGAAKTACRAKREAASSEEIISQHFSF